MNNRIMHFEIQTTDPEKSMKFYADNFGWTFEKYEFDGDPYYGVYTGDDATPGIHGGLLKSPDGVSRMINVIDVPNIDEYMENVISEGATVAVPKMPITGMGYCAYFIDPTGLLMGIFQDDSEAK